MPASIPILVGIIERSDGVFRKRRIEFYHIFRLQNSLDPMYVPAARKKNCCRRRIAITVSAQTKLIIITPRSYLYDSIGQLSKIPPFRSLFPIDVYFFDETASKKREYPCFDADRNSGPERSYSRFPARHAIPSPGFRRPKVEGLSALEPVTRHSALHAMRQVDRSRWMDRSDINVDAGR